jgi:hypothetical protein
MLNELKNYLSPVTGAIKTLRCYLADCTLVTDLISKLVITFGVVLLVGGLYLLIIGSGVYTQAGVNTVIITVNWIPGIPFEISALSNVGATMIGLVSWFVGIDLLLVGLGLWVRHKFAQYIALAVFALAAIFQFFEFFYAGIIGSPSAIPELIINGVLAYFIFSRFDAKAQKVKL